LGRRGDLILRENRDGGDERKTESPHARSILQRLVGQAIVVLCRLSFARAQRQAT
jgi:hypothetical protein